MASTFKTFQSDDIVTTRTLLHEAIPITGSIVNGNTYNEITDGVNDTESGTSATTNIKTFGHGMFQSVYDYPYQSSSANHIFDMTQGHATTAAPGGALVTTDTYYTKRKNIYKQMAQVLVGHKLDGSIRQFDADGNLSASGLEYESLVFFNFARLLGKDEIKKGTFELELGITAAHNTGTAGSAYENMHADTIKITDSASNYKVNSPAGEYGILSVSAGTLGGGNTLNAGLTETSCGLIFYQAGIIAITTELFMSDTAPAANANGGYLTADVQMNAATDTINAMLTGNKTMDEISTAIRRRISNIQFSNTTELNSTIYFCRVGHNDFNYSSNPTYLESSKIRVKDSAKDAPVTYITSVGLYASDNELLAVAKLSEPLRKDPTNDITLRVRLDY